MAPILSSVSTFPWRGMRKANGLLPPTYHAARTPVFDIEYYTGGMRWKDDNQEQYYLAGNSLTA